MAFLLCVRLTSFVCVCVALACGQMYVSSAALSHSGTRATFASRLSSHLGSREVIEPDGIMTRNLITALAKLLSVTVSVALTESLVEALNEDMRDLILPPLREYLPLRIAPIVTRGLVQVAIRPLKTCRRLHLSVCADVI
jgi:hypothetical protein